MISLDGEVIRRSLGDTVESRLVAFEAFDEIASTNSHLMREPGPAPGQIRAAITDNQTMGRGRHDRRWQSPPGSGLCLSLAYTYAEQPADLSALTLAIGLGAIDALEKVGVSGVQLKWPNDLIASDGKLGGILTESQVQQSGAITVVTGVGINLDLGADFRLDDEADRVLRAADLARYAVTPPSGDKLAASLIDALCDVFIAYETGGFARYVQRWAKCDWLLGREVTIDTLRHHVEGVGAGIAKDGALLVDTGYSVSRITSGTVTVARIGKSGA